MRALFALAGLHRVSRGAEIALESIARELAQRPGWRVTLLGTGPAREGEPYEYIRGCCTPRERFEHFPHLPLLRNEYVYEEATFAPSLWRRYRPGEFDVTATCAYPFTNWILRGGGAGRPAHVFITQNGDWPARTRRREYRFFDCDAMVCINPEHEERHRQRWPTLLVPNGVDVERFTPGGGDRAPLGLPDGPLAILVSALIPSKRVLEGIESVARVPGLALVVAGDGPLRERVREAGRARLGSRFAHVVLARERMPELYRCGDVLLHMSLDEPFGNVYVEAMSVGLEAVTHATPTTRWILGEQGELVDAERPEAVAEGIDRVLRRRSAARSAALRARAEARFSWRAIAGEYAAFFERIVAERCAA